MRVAIFVVLMLASSATAGQALQIYFMKDGDARAGDGILDFEPPAPLDVDNPANNTPPSSRVVGSFIGEQFWRPDASNNTGWILGNPVVGLWAPKSPAMDKAQLQADLVVFAPGVTPFLGEGEVLATTYALVEGGSYDPPNATDWVPPDPGSPEAAAAHIQGKALQYGLPILAQPPYVLFMGNETGGPLDVQIDPEARVGIRFQLIPDENETLPIEPSGQPIEYDFALGPSFALIPWYTEDPPRPTSTSPTLTQSGTTGAPTKSDAPSSTEAANEDSPLPLLAAVAVLGVAWARRR